jgi:isoquinoline 1-oxidoreductase beta subunit
MDRRSFIKSSAIVPTCLVIGFNAASEIAIAADATVPVAPWLRIAPDNSVTIINARSEMGQDTYTTMAMLIAEELEYPLGKVKIEIASTNPTHYINALLGGQITGGSTSVREAWTKLRTVGATAREQLKAAAAKKWNVSPADVTASNGVLTSGKNRATYGEIAIAAANMPLTTAPALKAQADFKLIGKRFPRLDTPAKVNGTAVYGIDVREPNMLVASLAQSPVIGGKPKNVDSSAAKSVPGVEAIVQISDGVAVLAKDFYVAKKARDLLKIEWDNGDTTAIDSMAAIESGIRNASKKDGAIILAKGNANPLDGVAKTFTAEYNLPYQAHATLEPINCAASVQNGECNVWGPIQFQQGATGAAMAASGLPEANVHIHTTFLGGGYGRKLELDFIRQAVEISKATGKTVRLQWTREDDMTHDFYRPASLNQVSAGVDANGKLTGLYSKMTSQSVTARAFPPFVVNGNDPFMGEGSANITYNISNLKVENVIHDSGVRVGYWRAVSNNLNSFAVESMIDEVATGTKQDPVAFRMSLLDNHPRAQKVLSTAAKKAGWGQPRSNGRFLGVAQSEAYGAYIAIVAEISMRDKKPVVHRLTAVVDPGVAIRPDQIKAQIESGMLLGLSSSLKTAITFKNGAVEQKNFDTYPMLRMSEVPQLDVTIIEGGGAPSGMGEVGVALVAPAIGNAIAAATGERIRTLPFIKV